MALPCQNWYFTISHLDKKMIPIPLLVFHLMQAFGTVSRSPNKVSSSRYLNFNCVLVVWNFAKRRLLDTGLNYIPNLIFEISIDFTFGMLSG